MKQAVAIAYDIAGKKKKMGEKISDTMKKDKMHKMKDGQMMKDSAMKSKGKTK